MKTIIKEFIIEAKAKVKTLGWVDLVLWLVPVVIFCVFALLGIN